MDSKGAKRMAEAKSNISYSTITGADHQLIFDNP